MIPAWLNKILLPRMVQEGLKLYGTHEISGTADNPEILAWGDETGVVYEDDSIPWCGLFMAVVAKRAGKPVVASPLWARNWAKFGVKSPEAGLGDVLVFQRPGGGGHVGLYIGEDKTAYHVLGGNQGDVVSIVRILKSRCIAVRRPEYKNMPNTVKKYFLVPSGGLSANEK